MTRQNMSESIEHLAMALSKFQGSAPSVIKGKTANVGQYKYTYADLADIFKSVSKTLMEYELSIVQFFSEEEGKTYLVTTLMHSSGQWIKSYLKVAHHEKIQQLGSEITYLRRYALSSILGIAAEDDDDGAQANQSDRKDNKKEVPKTPTKISKRQEEELSDLLVQVQEKGFIENMLKHFGVKRLSDLLEDHVQKAIGFANAKIKFENNEHAKLEVDNESASA